MRPLDLGVEQGLEADEQVGQYLDSQLPTATGRGTGMAEITLAADPATTTVVFPQGVPVRHLIEVKLQRLPVFFATPAGAHVVHWLSQVVAPGVASSTEGHKAEYLEKPNIQVNLGKESRQGKYIRIRLSPNQSVAG